MANRERAGREAGRDYASRPSPGQRGASGANGNGSVASGVNTGLRRFTGTDPVSGRAEKLYVDEKPPGSPGGRWWVGSWVGLQGKAWLEATADIVRRERGIACEPHQLLRDPLKYLEPWLTGRGRKRGSYGPPPSEGTNAGYRSALMEKGNSAARRYLQDERGLLLGTIAEFELGYDRDRDAITILIRDATGKCHSLKRRGIKRGARQPKRGLSRPASLYPLQILKEDPRAIVLCEGELDALLLNQHGIPALTSTAGTGGWTKYPEWHGDFAGRSVAVVYDCGAESYAKATARAEALREAGALDAWPVDLGLAQGEDVTDWFVKYGRDADALRELLNEERRRRRWRA